MTERTREQVAAAQADAEAMRRAVSGEHTEGTFHAYNWSDKPHRVLYDALSHVESLARTALSLMDRLADADMALALVVERARVAFDKHRVSTGTVYGEGWDDALATLEAEIRALAPASGVEDLAKLRAERDALNALCENRFNELASLAAKLADAEAKVAALREAGRALVDRLENERGDYINMSDVMAAISDYDAALAQAEKGGEE